MAAQLTNPVVKLTWQPGTDSAKIYNLYRAPLVVSTATNDDGVLISTESCGQWRKLGNTSGLAASDPHVVSGGRYCYAVSTVHEDIGVDINTNLPLSITSESALSDVIIVEVL
jgi:hypothetical protein